MSDKLKLALKEFIEPGTSYIDHVIVTGMTEDDFNDKCNELSKRGWCSMHTPSIKTPSSGSSFYYQQWTRPIGYRKIHYLPDLPPAELNVIYYIQGESAPRIGYYEKREDGEFFVLEFAPRLSSEDPSYHVLGFETPIIEVIKWKRI